MEKAKLDSEFARYTKEKGVSILDNPDIPDREKRAAYIKWKIAMDTGIFQ